jgi:hypothetical protein
MSRSDIAERAAGLPPPLVRLIHAIAEYAADEATVDDHTGEAEALADLGQLARVLVPVRGVLAPDDDKLYRALDTIATEHLRLGAAKDLVRKAVAAETREPLAALDDAHVAVRAVSDVAYYYAGLAFGITLACFGEGESHGSDSRRRSATQSRSRLGPRRR